MVLIYSLFFNFLWIAFNDIKSLRKKIFDFDDFHFKTKLLNENENVIFALSGFC